MGKKRKDGRRLVLLRLSKGRESKKRLSTGVIVNKSDFNSGAKHGYWIKYSDSEAAVKNSLLLKQYNDAENAFAKLIVKGDNVTVENSVKILKGESNDTSFFHFAEKVIQIKRDSGLVNTYNKHANSLRKLKTFFGKADMKFSDINVEFLVDYEAHLLKTGSAINTVNKELKVIRSWLFRAINQGLFEQGNNPFFRFKIKSEKTYKEKLTLDEIQRIEELDLKKGTLIWHVRNYFMFSYYTAGIRFGDFCVLRWENIDNGRLTYKMNKTSTTRGLNLTPQAQRILEYYDRPEKSQEDFIFSLLENGTDYSDPFVLYKARSSQNALVNKYLKMIAIKAGIKTNISFHIARHSFSEACRAKNISIYDISKALGHSSIKVTESYMKGFDDAAVDAAMAKVFNY